MLTRKVSLLILYDENGKILLQDRKGISKVGEKWGYFGGRIEEGETPEQALIRETKEELGFELKDFKFLGYYKYRMVKYNVQAHIFVSKFPNSDKVEQLEGTNMDFFTVEEAKKLDMKIMTTEILDDVEQFLIKNKSI